ncbi:hypothetical protein GALMADRAFT_255194 [Galerina marginata CBS 339.88]|uniref:Heme peroxidase n=1 Tax=Galerina marginata (strain CBS 339.88) TaxID=685588 RepID=A0A067SU40_GALM3|nr:hypothetical protein GALMADRAFT_255194 [Galerina marginata CBS 339.88]
MPSLFRRISQRADFYKASAAPLDTDGARPSTGTFEKEVDDCLRLVNPRMVAALRSHAAFQDAIKNLGGVGLDDRKMLLEVVLVLMSETKEFDLSMKMQQAVINLLYKDLPHPPSSYLCLPPVSTRPSVSNADQRHIKYAFRSADGYNTNPLMPTLGQAGSPYARSVPSTICAAKSALPDAGLVFDTLLKRDKFKEHPGGMSSLFFGFADLVIHSIFNTNHTDWTINDTSSYLDLSVLYGNSDTQLATVRRNDGSGKLWDDVFADPRLLMMPPTSCALLVLLNRNHNFIAQRLLDINENGNFSKTFPTDPAARQAQDDEIFHRSRLVNCGYFMQIILGDYVGAILGLVRDGSDWRLNPLMTYRDLSHDFVPTGQGNVVSVEFNLLYRWHATLSSPDTEWTTKMFDRVLEGKDPKIATVDDFKHAAHKYLIPDQDVKKWTFNNLKRDDDGRFKDADLANILHNATEARAGAFGARGIPETLRVIELMGIEQARTWGTCSLNEFRKFLGLKPYSTFKEWNPDKEIHKAAEALYHDIDNLELHVGLQAEETKMPGPGAGLCPGYTISRAILADAVSLTRGDRFMTVDFTPANLTAWGYQDCQYDTQDGSYGGLLTKLLFRTLPDYYPTRSAYAHFPFMVPSFLKEIRESAKDASVQKYSWTRPTPLAPTVPVVALNDVERVLTDTSSYLSAYDSRLFTTVKPLLVKPTDSTKGEELLHKATVAASTKFTGGIAELSKSIFAKPEANISTYFANKAQALLNENSFANGSSIKYVDVVKDVINLLPVHWISQEIAGLPLKTDTNPHGVWYEQDTYKRFADIAQYVYLNFEPENDWRLREASRKECETLVDTVQHHLSRFSLSDTQSHFAMKNDHGHTFSRKLWRSIGKNKTEFATQFIAATVPTAALYSQVLATVVDYYVGQDQHVARADIVKLVNSEDKDASDKVMAYVDEALRLDPPVAGVFRTAAKDDPLGSVTVRAGENVFASIVDANHDTSAFGSGPSVANYSRPSKDRGISTFISNGFLTPEFLKATIPPVLGSILSLKDLQRGPGQSGAFTRFTEDWHGAQRTQYISQKGLVSPFPDSLIIQFTQ